MNNILENIIPAFRLIKSKEPKKQKFKYSNLKRLLPYIRTHWKKAIIASILMIFVSLLALPTPYLMKYIIDDVITTKNFRLLNIIILLLIIIQISKIIFSILTNYFFNIFSQEILLAIKKDLFKKILRLPLSFFDNNQTGYIMSRIGEVSSLGFFFSDSVTRILIAILEFVFCLFILFFLHWKLTIISIFILPLFYLITKYYSKGIRRASRDIMEKGALVSKQFQESLSGVDVVKVFTAEERETRKIHHNLINLKQSSITSNIIHSISSEVLALLGALGGFLVLWYGGSEIIRGNFTIGSYIAFAAYLAKLYGPTQILASMGLALQPAATALNRISELSDLTTEDEDKRKAIKLYRLNGKIEFRNIHFSYDNKKEEVLRNINFKIEPGEKVTFVGPNGSGKSTILKLLLGLYKTERGKIFIDNQDIKKLLLSDLRERISIVSQNIFLFNDTIKNNILYSKPQASEEEVTRAVKLADAYNFIMNLENGFETIVGEIGKKISGGEKQKISIARSLLKDSDIIIFDEATSHLDNESEKRIQRMINKNFRNKTCIIVAHRLSTIINFDKFYVLDNGRIAKIGSGSELVEKK